MRNLSFKSLDLPPQARHERYPVTGVDAHRHKIWCEVPWCLLQQGLPSRFFDLPHMHDTKIAQLAGERVAENRFDVGEV